MGVYGFDRRWWDNFEIPRDDGTIVCLPVDFKSERMQTVGREFPEKLPIRGVEPMNPNYVVCVHKLDGPKWLSVRPIFYEVPE
ncbi:hypothetical protein DWB78_12330 [Halopelagius longus]|uniref:Uncharacterized protein n=2 Tax=Halopelagius longus TaxID=1236180 RepID=A0A370INZ0_9EURY|nr:hypothetical protein DWB78_12330 [Halopelagius longus]